MDEDLSHLFGNKKGGYMDVIQLIHGSQTFKNASSKVNVFVMRADGTAKRDFPNKQMSSVKGTSTQTPAALDGFADHGKWYGTRYEAKEGAILMLQASTTYHGAPYNNGCMLLALRENAPLLKVDVITPPNNNATYQRVPAFSGKADSITVEESKDYGIVMPKNFINNYFDEEELEELFDVSILTEGTRRPEMMSVRNEKGRVRKVAVVKEGGRRVRIRRK